jgi:hypothetical protein
MKRAREPRYLLRELIQIESSRVSAICSTADRDRIFDDAVAVIVA